MIIKIAIPENSIFLFSPGKKINLGEMFLEKKFNQQTTIPVSQNLNIPANKIFQYLQKFVGDRVKKNEILALKKGLFKEKKVLSPVDGIIKEIDHETGELILVVDKKDKKTLPSYFKGELISVSSDFFEIDIGKGLEIPLKLVKTNFGGKTYYLEESKSYQLSVEKVAEKIIIAEAISTLNASKIEVLGAVGLVTLKPVAESISLPWVQIDQSKEFATVVAKKFSYCLVNNLSSKIYFYN